MRVVILTIVVAALLGTGCSSKLPYYDSAMIHIKGSISLKPISDDLVELLSSKFNPSETTLYLNTKDFNNSFFQDLVTELRERGFAITNKARRIRNTNLNAVRLIYVAYKIGKDGDNVIVSFSINESKVNCIYQVEDGKLVRVGSVTGFDFK